MISEIMYLVVNHFLFIWHIEIQHHPNFHSSDDIVSTQGFSCGFPKAIYLWHPVAYEWSRQSGEWNNKM